MERLRPRYLRASREEKTKILDEFVALSGMDRKPAISAAMAVRERGMRALIRAFCIRGSCIAPSIAQTPSRERYEAAAAAQPPGSTVSRSGFCLVYEADKV